MVPGVFLIAGILTAANKGSIQNIFALCQTAPAFVEFPSDSCPGSNLLTYLVID